MTYNSVPSIVEMEEAAGFSTERDKHPRTICSAGQRGQVGDKRGLENSGEKGGLEKNIATTAPAL